MPTPVSTPTKRQPTQANKTQSPVRSTRSSGKAEYFQPLEGAPTATTTRRPEAQSRAKRASLPLSDDDKDTDGEVVAARSSAVKRTPSKAAPAKKASVTVTPPKVRLPSPSSSEADEAVPDSDPGVQSEHEGDEEASDLEEEEPTPVASPPSRKRAQRIAVLPLPPTAALNTPSKRRVTSVASAAPAVMTPLKKRARREAVSHEAADAEADEDVFGPVASTSSSSSTPHKSDASTAATTPSRSASKTVTPSRSSSRIQRLPPSLAEIANAPANLRNRLVGFHMEDEGYGVEVAARSRADEHESEDEDEEEEEEAVARRRAAKGKGKARMMEEDERVEDEDENEEMAEADEDDLTLPELPVSRALGGEATPAATTFLATDSSYPSSPLGTHLASTLALLTGARLPRPFLEATAQATLPPRDVGLLKLPYLEGGFDEWERPLRSALDECVTKGMGNAVMLLGPRGVGKTMVRSLPFPLSFLKHSADSMGRPARRAHPRSPLARARRRRLRHGPPLWPGAHDRPPRAAQHRCAAAGARLRHGGSLR